MPNSINNQLLEQESRLHKTNNPLDLIYIHQHIKNTICYLVRKRIIKNPYTNNIIGIHVNMEEFIPGHFRKIFLQVAMPNINLPTNAKITLTKAQNEIVFCIFLGFYIRKEIVAILSLYLNVQYSEHKVKNEITALYTKLECNSISSLFNTLLLNNVNITIPDGILSQGAFIIR